MPTDLTPAPSALGTGSPALGPWFSDAALTLAAPNDDLSVSVTLAAGERWLPPAGGVVGYYIASDPRPPALAALRQAGGSPAFTTGRLVVLFRLLPEVAARLASLIGRLPTHSRPAPVAFAFEVEAEASVSLLAGLIAPDLTGSDEEKAGQVGMRLEGGQLVNGRAGAAIYRRPGDADQTLITNKTGSPLNGKLWAFDERGRPVDPGAVAAWWNHLATDVFSNLWAEASHARTCPVAPSLTVALVNAHEGPLDEPLPGRLNLSGLSGSGPVRRKDGTGAATLGFTDAPTDGPDDAPIPRIALLPDGTYGTTLTLWEETPYERDFCRVAVVDVEAHLTGRRRMAPEGASEAESRRAADQNRESTRVRVGRTQAPALLTTLDAAADALVQVLGKASDAAHLVAGPVNRDYGGLDPLKDLPDVDPPSAPPQDFEVKALTGGGAAGGDTVTGQKALLTFRLDPSLAGAWVRAWTQGFDPAAGRHTWLDGGGGVVRASGEVAVVINLPDGAVSTTAPMGLNLLVVTAKRSQLYTDLRFERPAPVGGTPLKLADAAGNVLICETGQVQTGPDVTDIPSGCTLVQLSDPPALIDRSSIPDSAWRGDTLIRNLSDGDLVKLTPPAFKGDPAGDPTGALAGDPPDALASSGAAVSQHRRNLLLLGTRPGDPLPAMERLEVVASGSGDGGPVAAVASGPALSRYHELLPHASGHPGAPAAPEVHGTGVALNGDAASLVREYTRERTAGSTVSLARAAGTPLTFPGGDGPSCWAAPLRTVAWGVEMEVNAELLTALLGSSYPWGANVLDAVKDWLNDYGISLPDSVSGPAEEIVRAIDRRMLVGSRGAREGLIALMAAIRRAEDFVYIETPALDDQVAGPAGDPMHWLQTLRERMAERPGLRVLICFPSLPLPGTPGPLNRVRLHLAAQALQSLRAGANADRVAVFCPAAGPGRSLRLASTTVIVDDAWVMTGTTHLWRRGLTFDSSLAVALFDEELESGRPAEIVRFRRQLIADRLGLPAKALPTSPADLVPLIRRQAGSGGGGRIAPDALTTPSPAPSSHELAAWNPDGSPTSESPISWITEAVAGLLRNWVNSGQ